MVTVDFIHLILVILINTSKVDTYSLYSHRGILDVVMLIKYLPKVG